MILRHRCCVGEAVNFTQHIGAYKVKITKPDSPGAGGRIVFLDTLYHEAFTTAACCSEGDGHCRSAVAMIYGAADAGSDRLCAGGEGKAIIEVVNTSTSRMRILRRRSSSWRRAVCSRSEPWAAIRSLSRYRRRSGLAWICWRRSFFWVADIVSPEGATGSSCAGTVIEAVLDRGRAVLWREHSCSGTVR